MTYNEAYDKIIQAYFRDEIKPFNANFCFCGTLSPNSRWHFRHNLLDQYPYTLPQYGRMERALFSQISKVEHLGIGEIVDNVPYTEDELFLGMTAALEVLKQIHRERGEDVDSLPALTKRNLQPIL